jgi:hypothetical protein
MNELDEIALESISMFEIIKIKLKGGAKHDK